MAWSPQGPAYGPGAAAPPVSASSDPSSPDALPTRGAPFPPGAPAPLSPGYPLGPMRGGFSPAGHAWEPGFPARSPHVAPGASGAAQGPAASPDWGASSLAMDASHAAGLSYLGWWLTGLVIYFAERQNRFVRFHALQSIVYTGALTIGSVLAYVLSSLLRDGYVVTHNPFFQTLSLGVVLLAFPCICLAWWTPMIAAWFGYRLRIPVIAPYAERYAEPVDAGEGTPRER
jgi:uncharacterized membrane protein